MDLKQGGAGWLALLLVSWVVVDFVFHIVEELAHD
jgi:hypothetical protein